MDDIIKKRIFDFAYHEALNDATLQNAYLGKKDKIDEIVNAKEIVKDYIDNIVNGKPVWFYETEKNLEAIINEKLNNDVFDTNYFTFGNAQKLINMTAKYFFIACYFNKKYRDNFKNCHCPMDSKMIAVVRKKMKDLGMEFGEIKSDLSWSRLSSDSKKTSIKENGKDYSVPKAYVEFQKAIQYFCQKESMCPLEFDYNEW